MAKEGKVTYELRGDDSNLEKDLEKANKKVQKKTKESAFDVEKIEEKKTQKIKAESDKVVKNADKAADKVADAWKDAGKDAEKAMDISVKDKSIAVNVDADTSKAESKIKSVSKDKGIDVDVNADVSDAEDAIEGLEDTAEKTGSKISDLLSGPALQNIGGAMKDGFNDAITGAVPLVGKVGELTAGLSGAQAAAIGVGAATVGVGALAVNAADDMKGAMNDFLASTGKSREETERYQGVLENIYANNYGESFSDIGQAMAEVTKQLGDMDDAELQNVTESAYALRDTFGYEIPESTRAAKAMVDNFGISAGAAMNLIAAGAQNGLDYSGELLDSISEYSVQFEKMGFGASDMFAIFEKGAESGAFNLDKVGDAIKEMSIRMIDGSDTTKEGFEILGYSASYSADEIAKTENEVAELEKQLKYAQMEQEGFNEKTSELTRMKSADKIEEYSRKLESARAELSKMTNQSGETGKSMDDLIDKFGKGGKDAKQAFQEVISGLAEIEDPIEQNAAGVALFGTMWEDLGPEAVTALSEIENSAYTTSDAMNQLKDVKYDDLGSMFEELKRNVELLLIPIGEMLIPLLSILIETILPVITDLLAPLIELFAQLITPIINLISSAITPLIDIFIQLMNIAITPLVALIQNILVPIFAGALNGMASTVTSVIGNITNIFRSLIDFIKNVFTGNWKGAWENIKDIFSNAVSGLASIFKAPINAIIDGWNSLAGSLGSITIPDWVPAIGGNSWSLPKLSRLKVGLDYVPSDMFPAFLDEGEWVLTKEEANLLRSLGGLEGVTERLGVSRSDSMSVTVQNKSDIDYAKLGSAVVEALIRAHVGFKCDGRIFARLVKDVDDYA